MKRLLSTVLSLALLLSMLPMALAAEESTYSDVPTDSWAVSYIARAKQLKLMQGQGGDSFGYGKTVSNAEFAAMLCNIMGWELISPEKPSYSDVLPGKWYYQAIETANAHNAVQSYDPFQPDAPISRKEMTVGLIKALGLHSAALHEAQAMPSVYTDADMIKGYATLARDIGLLEGKAPTIFAPNDPVKREEAAALLVRFEEKYNGKTDFVHGYYAISSYSQKELAADMDAVTYQWSMMKPDGTLDTAGTVDKQLRIPDGYDSILQYMDGKTKQHLGVYMDEVHGLSAMLLQESSRKAAVDSIMAELERPYELVGKNPYSGVSIDFESMRGTEAKNALNLFLTDLSARLKAAGKTLYVCVPPALSNGIFYDGYDFKTIGQLSDKVILMAHDYDAASLKGYEGTKWHEKMALTPIGQVYYALKQATDPVTGVEDPDKLALAISFAYVGWYINEDGTLASATPVNLSPTRAAEVLRLPDTKTYFSETYRNPYLTYKTEEGETIFLWYENEQSVSEKLSLAKCFGINGVSLWRLGTIPNTAGYDVTGTYS